MKKKQIKHKQNEEHIFQLKEENHEDLIPKKEYFDFLDKILKDDGITQCQLKTFKKYYNSKEFDYPNSTSNKMIRSYFNLMNKDKKKYLFIRFYILLIHFLSSDGANEVLHKIKTSPNITDREVISTITNYINKKGFKPDIHQEEQNKDLCDEKDYLYSILFNKFIKILSNPKHDKNYKVIYDDLTKKQGENFKYLDIGCANGKKTFIIANIFKIPKKNVYCTDVPQWGPYEKNRLTKFNSQHFQAINPHTGIYNFPDNMFDFVSIILTMHHIPNLTKALNEIKRVMKPNGILLIIEHDALTKYDHLLIEIQHMLYGYTYDKKNPEWKNYIENRQTQRYMNIMEWTFILEKFKFDYLQGNVIFNDLSHQLAFDNQFYGFYKNIK